MLIGYCLVLVNWCGGSMTKFDDWDTTVKKEHWTKSFYPYLWFLCYFRALLNLVTILGLEESMLPLFLHIAAFSFGVTFGTLLLIIRIIELK